MLLFQQLKMIVFSKDKRDKNRDRFFIIHGKLLYIIHQKKFPIYWELREAIALSSEHECINAMMNIFNKHLSLSN